MKRLAELFLCFAKIGLFTFGGGYAMISFIEEICVKKKKWINHDEMMEITVIAESTPGPIAVNCATFVGYQQAGFRGALFATFGVVLPSFVIILLIAMVSEKVFSYEIVNKAFSGIQIAVGILICNAAVSMIQKMKKKAVPLGIMAVSFLIMMLVNLFSFHISSILLMLIAGIVNLCVFLVTERIAVKRGNRK